MTDATVVTSPARSYAVAAGARVPVQFHPESVFTESRKEWMQNFLGICRRWER